jgi:GGDEF domain-containing protein
VAARWSCCRTWRSARQPHGDHCAVLFVNLDRFKQVNDTYGNEVATRS